MLTPFREKVYHALRKIPKGKVTTYARLAAKIGHPGGARAVGTACAQNPDLIIVPCHRVVLSTGEVGQFSAKRSKRKILEDEGVTFLKNGKVNPKHFV